MFSEVFFTGLYTASFAMMALCIHGCYQSKCKEVKFCCLKIVRDVELEEAIDRSNPDRSSV